MLHLTLSVSPSTSRALLPPFARHQDARPRAWLAVVDADQTSGPCPRLHIPRRDARTFQISSRLSLTDCCPRNAWNACIWNRDKMRASSRTSTVNPREWLTDRLWGPPRISCCRPNRRSEWLIVLGAFLPLGFANIVYWHGWVW